MSQCKVNAMSFKLMPQDPLGETLRNIIEYQVSKMIHGLSDESISKRDGIHEMRRRSKKIRALLRLVQDNISSDVYRQENKCFSALSRTFNDVRDAEVLLETFAKVKEHLGLERKGCLGEIEEALGKNLNEERHKQLDENQGINGVVMGLQQALSRLNDWEIEGQGWSVLGAGILKTYGQGQVHLSQALALPSMTRIHEWRKKVRYLGFQLKLLQFLHPQVKKKFSQFAALGSLLGYHHDLAVLRETLLKNALGLKDSHSTSVLVDHMDMLSRGIEREVFVLGTHLFIKKPEKFEQSIKKYWES